MAIDRSGVVDEAVWDRFRLHINQSDPWWPVVLQLRWIERLLAGDPGVAASEVAAALGSMDDASYNAFNKAIVCLSSASSVRARLVPGPGFERRLAELSEALTSPTAAPAAREEAVRLNAIFLLRDQVRSVGRVPIEPGQGGGGQPRDAAVAAARVELFARYSRLVVQLVPGLASDTVITALVDLLGSYRELQTRAGV
ncbi:MAG: hypothetical protein M3N98_00880, partial [Actinomycetota bacterium]|nr:hypothetical protein [Actinomycetota bacterium]